MQTRLFPVRSPFRPLAFFLSVLCLLAGCMAPWGSLRVRAAATGEERSLSSGPEADVPENLLLAGAKEVPESLSSAAEAEEFVRVLFSERAASLNNCRMTDELKAALVSGGGMQGLAASLAAFGALKEMGTAYETVFAGQKVFRVPCRFENMPLDLMLVMEGDALAGISTVPYSGDQQETEEEGDKSFAEEELSLPVVSLGGALPGTLTIPEGEGPFPVVLLLHGSGPNDRDETVMNLKPFRDLAEDLAERGVASYRYDKRTYVYGKEMAEDHSVTLLEETLEDAVAAVALLREQEQIDPERIYVLGHSLGGMALPALDGMLKQQNLQAAGYIFLAASARPLDVLMREQYEYLFSLMARVTPEAQAEKDAVFAQLDQLEHPEELTEEDLIAGAYAPYWEWLSDYDPLALAREITAPCLVLQGEEDYQVTLEDFRLWQENAEGKDNWQFISYPGLVHAFIPGKKTEGSAVYMKNARVDPRVSEDIAGFVLGSPETE